MYFPYFRGKQFELITIRDNAELMAQSGFIPIIEPVREVLKGLERTLNAVNDANGKAILIVNPHYGDHRENGVDISDLLEKNYNSGESISAGILLKGDMHIDEIMDCYHTHKDHTPTLIHAGFTEAKSLANALSSNLTETTNIFLAPYCGKLYRKHFFGSTRVLIKDGFRRQRNADYPLLEEFSDLHATYTEDGMNGFGDFLTVGDDYSESGGPAYAVAIHLSFIDPEKDGSMYIYHFVSDTKDTPTDPAGKFAEALKKLVDKFESGTSNLLYTSAIKELQSLNSKGHFPGLGTLKKLSMMHHIETLSVYLKNNG